ncbi:uncharacterized protein LOC142348151 isoform X2 [Convolutriloba macropyga]|uniref:uncharacterized protein LOC142348151 isoform X2 n=1 Tax=Convolutriloba macropyga TaxID=536237 RepID=UPI003F526F4A
MMKKLTLHYLLFVVLWLQCSNVASRTDFQLLKVTEIGVTSADICWRKSGDESNLQFFLLHVMPKGTVTGYDGTMHFDATKARNINDRFCYPVKDLEAGTQYDGYLSWRKSGDYSDQYSKTNVTFSTAENPCHAFGCASGTCQSAINDNNENEVSCVCYMGYYGHKCEHHNPCVLDPCEEYPCTNTTNNRYYCVCPNGQEVDGPEKCRHMSPCDEEPCGDNGICTQINSQDYTCTCNEGYFGRKCERKNYCFQVNCHNGGKCVNRTNDYDCECQRGFMGKYCDQRNPCEQDKNPCQNNGFCHPSSSRTGFYCTCASGFYGAVCEESDPCEKNPCENGQCVKADNSGFNCECPSTHYGKLCQHKDLCINQPCDHGKCTTDGNSFKCECEKGWLGKLCEIKDQCQSSQPCKNGGECRMDAISGSYHCKCRNKSGYWGKNCEYFDECVNSPCQHQGICKNITYERYGKNEYKCECMGNFRGENCEFWDNCKTQNYCEYQGVCSFTGHNKSTCECRPGYYGDRCENYNLCEVSDPCQNDGKCKPAGDNGYTCECKGGYSGENCDLFDPCQNMPCKNGGICVATDLVLGLYTCNCFSPYYGARCESENYCQRKGKDELCGRDFICRNLTTMHYVCEPIKINILEGPCSNDRDCLHGGKCDPGSNICDCKPPYNGARCEQIDPCTDASVCSGNGECMLSLNGNNAYCDCQKGFFGSKCEYYDPCLLRSCQNGGNCVKLNWNTLTRGGIIGQSSLSKMGPDTVCHCPMGYHSEDCSKMNQPCVTNECLNGGQCLQAISTKRGQGGRTNVPTSYYRPGEDSVTFPSVYQKQSRRNYMPQDNFICECDEKYKGRRCETLRQCLGREEKLDKEKGIVEWKSTEMGQVSMAACPFGSQSLYSLKQVENGAGYAFRDCDLVDHVHGKEAEWGVPNADNCDPRPATDQEADRMLESVLLLVKEAGPWEHSPESIEYAGTVLRNLVPDYIFRDINRAQKYFEIIDRLLDIPSQIRFQSEVQYGAISRLLKELEIFMDKFVIADLPTPVVIEYKNIRAIWATHATEYPETHRNPPFRFSQPEFDLKLSSKLFPRKASKDDLNENFRVQLVVFKKDGLFLSQRVSSFGQIVPETDSSPKTTTVISLNIKGSKPPKDASSDNIQISFQLKYEDKFRHHCAFWQPNNRKWETMGLLTEVFENSTVCKSSHMTSFTVLKMNSGRLGGAAPPSVLPFVGCGIACIAFSLLAVTYAIVRSARRNVSPGVVVHLSVSLLLLNISMMFASIKDRMNPVDLCSLVSVTMHYLICTSLMWYCVEALFRFKEHSLANNSSVFYKCAAIAWGTPAIICGASVVIKMGLDTISDTYCRVTPALQFSFYALLLIPSIMFLIGASLLYLLHICKFSSQGYSNHSYHQSQTLSPNNASYLTNTAKASTSQTILVLCTMIIFVFNWVLIQIVFPPGQIHIFDFAFCFGNVIQSTLLFSTLCLLSDDARYAWHYFWAPSQTVSKSVAMTDSKMTYSDGTLLGDNANKLTLSFSGSCHTPSVSPHSPTPSRNGKCSNGTLTRNPGYSNHDSLTDIRSTVANGAVIFGETREIKQAVACLNTQGSFGSSISSGLNPETSSDRFQRGDPYAASYPQAATLFRDNNPSPTFSNPERESYV